MSTDGLKIKDIMPVSFQTGLVPTSCKRGLRRDSEMLALSGDRSIFELYSFFERTSKLMLRLAVLEFLENLRLVCS